jgi:hypothetical protein
VAARELEPRAESGSSLVQASAKRNMPTPVANRRRRRGESRLLDRHGEPGDQPRDFVQMFGIVRFNGLREPKQAFVVTHGGNADWNNRRYRADQVGRSGGIESAPVKPGTTEPFGRLSRIDGPIHHSCVCRNGTVRVPATACRGRKRRQIIVAQGLSGPASRKSAAGDLVLCKPERLCYTLPAREPLFACSSVAQR